jgi:hypothetical protein
MTRAKCKQNDHWVDREDCLLVTRSSGGSYNRAPSNKQTLICVECAERLLRHIIENGGRRGHWVTDRWSISSLEYAYNAEMRYREHFADRERNDETDSTHSCVHSFDPTTKHPCHCAATVTHGPNAYIPHARLETR